MTKITNQKFLLISLLCSASCLNNSYALEEDQTSNTTELARQDHSIQGLILPFIYVNALHVAYEHKVSSAWGVRADGILVLSSNSYALFGALSASRIVLERKTDTASHAMEFNAGLGTLITGEMGCDPNDEDYDFVDYCSLSAMGILKGFVGYRYQKFSGFHLRAGIAPLAPLNPSQGFLLLFAPEITLGISF